MTDTPWFKLVAADLTTRDHKFSYLDALRTGQPIEATDPDPANNLPCPSREGDGLCVARTVAAACSGGQPASSAVGLVVAFDDTDVLGGDGDKVRVRALRVTDVFDPMHLIRLGLCADLRDANLRGANLRGANLRGADLRGADLRGADLWDADLWDANLWDANLRGANLRGANLWGANLWGANLWGANLWDANLRDADLRGANLWDANLRGADLPDGFTVPAEAIR